MAAHQAFFSRIFGLGLVLLGLGISGLSLAQTTLAAPLATANPASAALPSDESKPRWTDLSPLERQSLEPLREAWPTLSQGHRRKWQVVAKNFTQMSDSERERLHSRMVDWAALSPKEREQARVNFAETKKLPADARAATWEAYQALPEEEKQALLQAAPKKPAGAAVAPRPIAPHKLAEVPVTRKSPEPVKASISPRPAIDRYTLLPIKETAPSAEN